MLDRQLSAPLAPRQEDFVIGDWRVQPSRNRIVHRGAGGERKLEPRLMHLLGFLAANAGQTLGREALVAELWPRVIVTENSLTRAVSELRKHLGAAGGQARIETVPKKGYRLVIEGAARDDRRRRALPWPAFALSGLAAATLVAGWLAGKSPATVAPYRHDNAGAAFGQEFMPVSSASGGLAEARHEAPVLSADGARFAFIRRDASGSTIWLGELRGGAEPIAVYSSGMSLANLVWSPTGDALLFARRGAINAEAIYGGASAAQLMQFDLATWTVSTLVEEPEQMQRLPTAEVDLT